MAVLSASWSEVGPGSGARDAAPGSPATARLAGLDGLRAFAVALVVVYHLWPWLLPGGFLGVTVFFALSGYLITHLLMTERERSGSVRLGDFYARRVRRLLPLSFAVLVIVAVVWVMAGWMSTDLGLQMRFSVAQLANWGQIVTGERYGAATDPSPIVHYWSLAIEEQTYLVLPLLVLATRTRRRLAIVLSAGIAACLAVTLWADGDPLFVYFSTWTRIAEILIGAAFALIPIARRSPSMARIAPVVVVVSVLMLLVAARTVSLNLDLLYRGMLPLVALVAAVAVLFVVTAPRFGRLLDRGVLGWIGQRSYGIYLIHWPLLIALTLWGVPSWLVGWLVIALTVLMAAASWRWFEQVVRSRSVRLSRVVAGVAIAATLCLGASAIITDRLDYDYEAAAVALEQLEVVAPETVEVVVPETVEVVAPAPPAATRVEPERPLVYSYLGDSKALTLAYGLAGDAPEGWMLGPTHVEIGCPLGRGGQRRHTQRVGPELVMPTTGCDWSTFVAEHRGEPIDVAVVWYGSWDAVERQVPELGDDWWTIADEPYRAYLLGELDRLTDSLLDEMGAGIVVYLTSPPDPHTMPAGRMEQWNQLLTEFVASRGAPVHVFDIDAAIRASTDAARLLPDGIHVEVPGDGRAGTAREVHERFMADQIERWWRAARAQE